MDHKADLTDPATGLATRAAFDHLYGFAFSLGDRGVPPTLLLLAPDGASDAWPDGLTNDFGRALRLVTRRSDVVARYEQDEFACLLVDCNAAGAIVAADRIRGSLAEAMGSLDVTLSAGVATYHDDMDGPDDLVEAARRALRSAQEAGGDRTERPPAD